MKGLDTILSNYRASQEQVLTQALAKQLKLPPAPCDECPLWDTCKRDRIACEPFYRFVQGNRSRWTGDWKEIERLPEGYWLELSQFAL